MKKPTMRILALALAGAVAAGLAGCGDKEAPKAAAQTKELTPIGIVQLVEHDALYASNRGIVDALAERGFKDGVNIKLDKQNAQADQSNLHNIAQRFVSNKSKLIFAIATPAAQSVAGATKDIPIVATAVTNFEVAKLVQTNEKPGGNVTGVSDINPVAEQVDLLLKLVPNAKAIGTIYNSSEVNSEYQVKLLNEAAAKKQLTVVPATVTTVNDLQQAINSLKGKVDAVYLPTDNVVASALPALMKAAIPAKLPVIAAEGGMVRQGALASIAIDYYVLGKMTGQMGADILEGKAKPATMPIQTQHADNVIVNMKTAKEIGLTIPEDVLAKASKVE